MPTNRERLLAQMLKRKEAPSFKVYGEYPGLIKSVEKHNDKTYKANVDLIDENDTIVNQTLYLTKAVDIPNIQSCYEFDEITDNNISDLEGKVIMFQLRPNKNYTNDLFKYQFTAKAPEVVYTDTQESTSTDTEEPAF